MTERYRVRPNGASASPPMDRGSLSWTMIPMETRDISIATITWARDSGEEALLRRALTRLTSLGMRVAVADAGTNASFAEFLRQQPGVTLTIPNERGLIAQVEASLVIAEGFATRFVLYTEPDKDTFFEQRLPRFMAAAPDAPTTGVVLATRSDASFATYPSIQQYTEGVASHLCGEIIGVRGDYFYGPFLIARSLIAPAPRFDRALGWGWRPAMFVAAHRAGLDVVLVPDDHPCPPDQRAETPGERTHRLRQLSQNIAGLAT